MTTDKPYATASIDDIATPSRRARFDRGLAVAPLVPPAIGLCLGIAMDAYVGPATILSIAAFATAGIVLFVWRPRASICAVLLVVAGTGVGSVLHASAYRRIEENQIVRYTSDAPMDAYVTGRVLTTPMMRRADYGALNGWFPQPLRTSFLLATVTVRGRDGPIPVTGVVRVSVREALLQLDVGDRVRIFGRLYRSVPPNNPGERDWQTYQRRQGVLAGISTNHRDCVTKLAAGARRGWLTRMRLASRRWLFDDVTMHDPASQSLLEAIILGQRSHVERTINEAFVRTGAVHILSVSGSHLAMLAGAIWFLATLAGWPQRRVAGLVLIAVIAYALLAEPNAPIIRATIMVALLCFAIVARRPIRTGNWLAASALIILALRPCDLFDIGFQLSYTTLFGVIYLSRALWETTGAVWPWSDPALTELRPRPTQRRTWRARLTRRGWMWLKLALAVSIAAWLAGAPLTLYHFGRVSSWGWLNSILITPLVGLLMLAGFLKLVVSAIWPSASVVVAAPVAWSTHALDASVRWLAAVPGVNVHIASPPLWLAVFWLLILSLWILQRPLRLPGHAVAVAMLAGLIAGVFVYGARKPAADAVHVRVLSVGAGAATVIHLPNGHAFLYDVGHSPPYELGGAVIAPTLNTTGIRRLDGIMISHPNLDHYSGVLDVIDRIPTRRVWVSSPFLDARRDSRLVGYVLDSLTKRGVPVTAIHAGDCLTGTGDVAIDVLWPSHDESVDALEANDTSIVLRLRYGHSSMLLCGDIERAAQAWLLDHADLHADVLVLPHHGSYKPWTPAFLQAVAPTYLVRSSNQRDEQSAPGLMKLAEDYRYYNTAESGAIDIMLTRDSIRLEAFHGQQEGRPVLTPAGP